MTLPRLTEADILDLLKSEVSHVRIAQLAAERGVSFDMAAQNEQALRDAGADDDLIDALRKARR